MNSNFLSNRSKAISFLVKKSPVVYIPDGNDYLIDQSSSFFYEFSRPLNYKIHCLQGFFYILELYVIKTLFGLWKIKTVWRYKYHQSGFIEEYKNFYEAKKAVEKYRREI